MNGCAQCERGMFPGGGAGVADGTPRSGGHLLSVLQDGPRLEICELRMTEVDDLADDPSG